MFDERLERRGTYSSKWEKYAGTDIIPLWVADMDFRAAPAIRSALAAEIEHGVFGYSVRHEMLPQVVVDYLQLEYGWSVAPSSITWLGGLVPGLNLACRALCAADEAVITATPIYPPFMSAALNASRALLKVPLLDNDGLWEWDFKQLEHKISISTIKPRLLLLCNPHNPVGRMWRRHELERLLDIVLRYDLLVCSDEIHCDLILSEPAKHIPFASLSAEASSRTITLMSPSKTYNLAGLNCAFIVAENPVLQQKLVEFSRGLMPSPNLLGLRACEVALTECRQWRLELLEYLRGNLNLLKTALAASGMQLTIPEATYLAWIDGRDFMAKHKISNLAEFFADAGVGLSDGADFGAPGFVRLNFGTQRELLREALGRMLMAMPLTLLPKELS